MATLLSVFFALPESIKKKKKAANESEQLEKTVLQTNS